MTDLMEYIINDLECSSVFGRKKIKSITFLKDEEKIQKELDNTEIILNFLKENPEKISKIKETLMHFKDIYRTLKKASIENIFDDIELFEIKHFCIFSEKLREEIKKELETFSPQKLENIVTLLDPEGLKINSFYVYSAYSEKLKNIRELKKKIKLQSPIDETAFFEITQIENEEENIVRQKLSKEIFNNIEKLIDSYEKIGYLDFLLSKSEQIISNNFSKPIIDNSKIQIRQMFNPEIKNNLEKENEEYQKIDFFCEEGITLITGANMTGKTVILKTLALIQNMMQYGFYVPAEYASLPITDEIFMLSGDLQSIQSGLSSFAAEILFVNKIYKHSKTNKKSLILMDELARNTNPHEGKAIVKAMISLLKDKNSFSIITSHYEGVNSYEKNIKNYRVKGLKKDKTTEISVSYKHIAKFIDYSLVEFKQGEKIPEEALTIAKLLDVDEDIIKKSKDYLGN